MRIPLEKIKSLMWKTKDIRNVGVVAHVDHGKSTLSDVILSEAGYIAKDLAGKLLYLDYLEEEQKRGVTIKTSAISLILKTSRREYLLNLVDTPGHVDFSGKITRALRLIDGAILVIDAAEGIMSQTEYVLRELIKENVRPILFINKIDRLILEMNYSSSQIQARLEEIILKYNSLTKTFGREDWEYYSVNPKNETVLFGSALYRWGFTVKTALEQGIKFDDIIKMVKDDPFFPSKKLPLGALISRIIYEKLPNPINAQKKRVPRLWNGQIPDYLLKCDTKGTTIVYIGKIQYSSGRMLCTARVFSGILKPGTYINLGNNERVRINHVGVLLGSSMRIVREVAAGNVVGLVASKCEVGSTLGSEKVSGYFKKPSYRVVPVIYVAVTPLYPRDFEKLLGELEKIRLEEQNIEYRINRDTGQILVWGIGELQLELIIKELGEKVKIYTSEPLVSYREIPKNSVRKESDGYAVEIKPINTGSGEEENHIELKGFSAEEREIIKGIIDNMFKSGPLVGEPIYNAKILVENKDKRREVNINRLIELLTKALIELETEISEPYYKFEIVTKPEYIGTIINELNRRGGKIDKIIGDEGDTVSLRGIIPVRMAIGLPSTLRELTHGDAYIQLMFHDYLEVSEKVRESIINEIKSKKGLI